MKKEPVTLFCVALILFLSCSEVFCAERPKDFRELKWGIHVSTVSGLVLIEEKPIATADPILRDILATRERMGLKFYRRSSDDLQVGHGQVASIVYVFAKDQLTGINMEFKDYRQYLNLKSLFYGIYGLPDKEGKRKTSVITYTEHFWYANTDDEANVTLSWEEWTNGKSEGTVLMRCKGSLKQDSGL